MLPYGKTSEAADLSICRTPSVYRGKRQRLRETIGISWLILHFSNTLLAFVGSATGLYLDASLLSPLLKIGTICVSFHLVAYFPNCLAFVKTYESDLLKLAPSAYGRHDGSASGPIALLVTELSRILNTFSDYESKSFSGH